MTEAEKWRTLAQVLAVTVPLGTLIGLGLGWLIGGAGASMAAGAVIGLLVTAGFVAFDVSWTVGLIPRSWRESPFLVVLVTRSLCGWRSSSSGSACRSSPSAGCRLRI